MRFKVLGLLTAVFIFTGICSDIYAANNGKKSEKKKIVFVKDDNSEFFNNFAVFIEKEFEKHGWTKKNSEYIVLSMDGKIEKAKENVEKIKKINPDIVYINGTYVEERIMPLKGLGIPVVMANGIDFKKNGKYAFLNKNGMPASNIAGLYTYPKNFELNSLKLLNSIAPIKGKKAVVLGQPGLFNEDLKKAFKTMNIPLKFYKNYKYFEDFQKDFMKYNNDPQVGWLIVDGPITRKDGKEWTRRDTFLWEHKNIKKPNVAFFQNNIEQGALCGMAVDPMGYVMPSLEMCYDILRGKKPGQIKPGYPDKIFILVNQKAALQIGVSIPVNVLKSAWKIYTDYDGSFQAR